MRAKKFWLPDGRPFEIPIEWWTEAGMDRFFVVADISRASSTLESKIVLLADIDLPSMDQRERSHGQLDRERMISVLWSIAERVEIFPVLVTETTSGNYRYQLHDGAHRFHVSAEARFTHIPATIIVR